MARNIHPVPRYNTADLTGARGWTVYQAVCQTVCVCVYAEWHQAIAPD